MGGTRDRIGHFRQTVRGAEITDRPGAVALRAQAGGFAAPEAYRADHGTRLSLLHPQPSWAAYVQKKTANFDTLDIAPDRFSTYGRLLVRGSDGNPRRCPRLLAHGPASASPVHPVT
ncbi:hypothetical protein GCM10010392_23400 [Streptomyces clavifer]|nr:hypothetical protein GCM10010392_23400 [Streptomyces clavifer]